MDDITITELPDILDSNKMIRKEIKSRYHKCPFCGETRSIFRDDTIHFDSGISEGTYISWYGYPDEMDGISVLKMFKDVFTFRVLREKKHHWRIDDYECLTCGAEWVSNPYPTDILNVNELKDILNNMEG